MDHPTIHALFNYWDHKRDTESAPARADIHPGDIRGILPEIFLLERNNSGRFYYRLAGTLLCRNARRELKGQRPLAHFADLDRRKMQIALTQVAEKGVIFKADILGTSARGRTIEQQWIVLPLKNTTGSSARLIGACATLEEPVWLGRDPIVRNSILSARMISTKNEKAMQELSGRADPDTPFEKLRSSTAISLYALASKAEPNMPHGIADLQARIEQQFGRRQVRSEPAKPLRNTDRFQPGGFRTPNFNVVPLANPEKRVQHLTVFDGGRES